jgi:hypothetical protein
LMTIFTVGFVLRVPCDGSTFTPITSPMGDSVYFIDNPTNVVFGLTLTGCASECMFYSSIRGGSSSCRCFNYDSSTSNCSLFTSEPTKFAIDPNGHNTAYQVAIFFVLYYYYIFAAKRLNKTMCY